MGKTCLECGDSLLGRADKKFCSDLCRNAYNNKLNSDATSLVRNINNVLRKNRRVIGDFINDGITKVNRNKLNESGFNFQYITHQYKTQKGSIYFFCYEFGYLSLENDYFLLVKREEK